MFIIFEGVFVVQDAIKAMTRTEFRLISERVIIPMTRINLEAMSTKKVKIRNCLRLAVQEYCICL